MNKELVVVQPIIINHGLRVDCRDDINMRDKQLEKARALSTESFARVASQKIKMKEHEMMEKDWKEMTTEELGKNIEKIKKESAKKLEKLEKKIKKYEKEIEKLKNQVKSAIAGKKRKSGSHVRKSSHTPLRQLDW